MQSLVLEVLFSRNGSNIPFYVTQIVSPPWEAEWLKCVKNHHLMYNLLMSIECSFNPRKEEHAKKNFESKCATYEG
jgi:hypothetical protein